MSAMGIGDSKDQMRASNWLMGRLTLNLIIPYMLKVMTTYYKLMRMNIVMIMMMQECFADLEESEQLMMAEQEASEGALTMTVVRAPVLRDSSSYVHDYAAGGRRLLVTCPRTFAKSFFSSTIVVCEADL